MTELGFSERNGYHHRGDPWKEERHSVDEYVIRARRRELQAGTAATDEPALVSRHWRGSPATGRRLRRCGNTDPARR